MKKEILWRWGTLAFPLVCLLLLLLAACGPVRPRLTAARPTPLPLLTVGPTVTPFPTLNRRPTVTRTPTVTPTPIIYVVRRGDYLERIAANHEISLQALMLANGLESEDILSIGQKIIIPNESMLEQMARQGLDVKFATPTPAYPTPTLRADSIPWNQAERHANQEVSVEGAVLRTRRAGGDVLLFFQDPPEGLLCVRLPAEALNSFAADPEIYYLDHWVLVKGVVEAGPLGWQITVRKRTEISILE